MKKLALFILLIPTICWALQDSVIRPTNTTASRLVSTDTDKKLISVSDPCVWLTGDGTFISCISDGDGTSTIDFVADYSDISTNDAATDVTGTELETLTDTSNADLLHAHSHTLLEDLGTGADHSYIDQDVTSGSSPTFDGTNITGVDHGTDDGLGDDDHTQYALLAGRAGSQVLYGNNGTTGYLGLRANTGGTHASSRIYIGTASAYWEQKEALGIGTISPGNGFTTTAAYKLHLESSGTGAANRTTLGVRNTNSGGAAAFNFENSAGGSFGGQINGATYAGGGFLRASLYTQRSIPFYFHYFQTDGELMSGGTSPIYFATGGYNSQEFVVFTADHKMGVTNLTPTARFEVESAGTADIVQILRGYAGQLGDMFQIRDSSENIHHSFSLPGATDPNTYINKQTGDSDFIVAGDTEANLLRVDAGLDTVRLGDWDTNYLNVGATGNTSFAGTATFQLPSANRDPAATSEILHDTTVAGFTNGAVRYYNGAAIKQIIDMTAATAEACTDDQVVVYDAAADLWYCYDGRADHYYGSLYTYNKAVSLNINTANAYHAYHLVAAGDVVTGLVDGWTFDAGRNVDADVSAEANNGGLLQIDTSAAHNLTTGDIVVITNANDAGHNDKTRVTVDDADTFTCDDIAYVAGAGASAAEVDEPAYLEADSATNHIYNAAWSISGSSAIASKIFKFELVQNITDLDNTAAESTFSSTGIQNVAHPGGLIQVNTGDRIWIQCLNVTGDTTDFSVKDLTITLTRK